MNSRKYPRTMQEAFGPYTSRELSGPTYHQHDKIVMWGCVIAIVTVALLAYFGVLK